MHHFESVFVHAVVQTIRGWLELYLHQVGFIMMIQVTCALMKVSVLC